MDGAAKVLFNLTNLTTVVSNIPSGIIFAQGQAMRGPFSDTSEIINSWPRFVEKHGGLISNSDTPLLVKRFLEKGGRIRFSRVGHYEDITDKESLDAKKAILSNCAILTIDKPIENGEKISGSFNGTVIEDVIYSVSSQNTLKKLAEQLNLNSNVNSIIIPDNEDNILYINFKGDITFEEHTLKVTDDNDTDVDAVIVIKAQNEKSFTNTNQTLLFTLEPKYEGLDMNNISVIVTSSSNGLHGYFNLYIKHKIEPTLNESFINLNIKKSSVELANYLNKVNKESKFVNVIYRNTENLIDLTPTPLALNFIGGTDGTEPQLSDYIGDSSSLTGLHAFDEYDDSFYLATFDDVDIDNAGAEYAKNRDDLAYVIHLEGQTKQSLITEKDLKNIDDKHTIFVGGSVKIIDPITSAQRIIKETADILALAVNSDNNYGPWFSFAGPNRGVIGNVLGVGVNFGTPSKYKDLDELADRNINMVITRDNSTKLWGNFSGQMENNQERYFSVVKLIFFLKKALRPILEKFLEEPNDIKTWLRIYYSVDPLFEQLKNKRAIYNYRWDGDQFAKSMEDLKVNNKVDVTQGKYKAILALQAINSLREILVGIVMTDAGVDFEIINSLN